MDNPASSTQIRSPEQRFGVDGRPLPSDNTAVPELPSPASSGVPPTPGNTQAQKAPNTGAGPSSPNAGTGVLPAVPGAQASRANEDTSGSR